MHNIDKILQALNITLPASPKPAANYVPFVNHNGLVFVSGQLPVRDGQVSFKGRLGEDVDLETGAEAAKLCAINILAVLKQACDGDWDKVDRCLRIGGFVCSTNEFAQQPLVINGASDLIGSALGEKGRHARAAVGVNVLPLGACVEVEALFAMKS